MPPTPKPAPKKSTVTLHGMQFPLLLAGLQLDDMGRIIIADHRYYLGKVTALSEWAITSKGVAMQSPTGTGKSTLILDYAQKLWDSHKMYTLVIEPTTPLCDQLAKGRPYIQVVKGGHAPTTDDPGYTAWVSTPDSLFVWLENYRKHHPHDPTLKDVFIVVDEYHHICDRYRPVMDLFMRAIRDTDAPKLFTSATPPNMIPYFPLTPMVRFIRQTQKVVVCRNFIGSVANAIKWALFKKSIPLVHMNNKRKAKALRRIYEKRGLKVIIVTSDNKDEIMEDGLIDGILPEADIYISTAVLNDGISVNNLLGERVTVIFSSESIPMTHARDVVQFASRPRDTRTEKVEVQVLFVRKSAESFSGERVWTEKDEEAYREVLKNEAVATVDFLNARLKMRKTLNDDVARFAENSADMLNKILHPNGSVVRLENPDRFELNETALLQAGDSKSLSMMTRSQATMAHWLAPYGFTFEDPITFDDENSIDQDVLEHSNVLSNDDKVTAKRLAASFATFEEMKKASKAEPPSVISDSAHLVAPFEAFKEQERERARLAGLPVSEEEITEWATAQHRKAIRDATREDVLKIRVAKDILKITNALTDSGMNYKDAFKEAKKAVLESTMTNEAIRLLKHKALLRVVIADARNPAIAAMWEAKIVRRLVDFVARGQPIDLDGCKVVARDVASTEPLIKKALFSRFDTTSTYQPTPKPELTGSEVLDKKLLSIWEEENAEGMARHERKRDRALIWEHERLWKLLNALFKIKSEKVFIDGKQRKVKVAVSYQFDSEVVSNSVDSQTERLDNELRQVVTLGEPYQEATDKVIDAHVLQSDYLAQKLDTPKKRKRYLNRLFVFKRKRVKGEKVYIPVSAK